MNVKMAVSMMICIFAVVLTLLALQATGLPGEWATVAPAVTSVIVMIAFLSFVIVAIVGRK